MVWKLNSLIKKAALADEAMDTGDSIFALKPNRRDFLAALTGMILTGCGSGGSGSNESSEVTLPSPSPSPSLPPPVIPQPPPANLGAILNVPLRGDLLAIEGAQLSYTRNSSATVIGSDGLLVELSANDPRFLYDSFGQSVGLLIEGSNNQFLLQTENYSNAVWNKKNINVTSNQGIATDGTTRLWLLDEGNNTGSHTISQPVYFIGNSEIHTLNAVVKANDLRFVALQMSTRAGNFSVARFDLNSRAVVSNYLAIDYGINDLGNGFLHLWAAFDAETGPAAPVIYLQLLGSNETTSSYRGTNRSIYVSEMWVNQGVFSTSYLRAVSVPALRAADLLFDDSNYVLPVNDCSGIFAFQYNGKNPEVSPVVYTGLDENNYFAVSFTKSQLLLEKVVSGLATSCIHNINWQVGSFHAVGWRMNRKVGMELVLDGQQVAVNRSVMAKRDIDLGSRIYFGSDGKHKFCNCPISNIMIFREA